MTVAIVTTGLFSLTPFSCLFPFFSFRKWKICNFFKSYFLVRRGYFVLAFQNSSPLNSLELVIFRCQIVQESFLNGRLKAICNLMWSWQQLIWLFAEWKNKNLLNVENFRITCEHKFTTMTERNRSVSFIIFAKTQYPSIPTGDWFASINILFFFLSLLYPELNPAIGNVDETFSRLF